MQGHKTMYEIKSSYTKSLIFSVSCVATNLIEPYNLSFTEKKALQNLTNGVLWNFT